jgi:cytochrome P450
MTVFSGMTKYFGFCLLNFRMPYTEAIVLETLRMSSLLPLGIPHCTMKDVSFHDFLIPKGTLILSNSYEVHHNETVWGDPQVFRPERFLTSNGKEIDKNHPPILPFSIGKRTCLGETLARDNLFLFLTSLFQRFRILPDPVNPSQPKMSGALFRSPPTFKVILQDRLEFLDRNEDSE